MLVYDINIQIIAVNNFQYNLITTAIPVGNSNTKFVKI